MQRGGSRALTAKRSFNRAGAFPSPQLGNEGKNKNQTRPPFSGMFKGVFRAVDFAASPRPEDPAQPQARSKRQFDRKTVKRTVAERGDGFGGRADAAVLPPPPGRADWPGRFRWFSLRFTTGYNPWSLRLQPA
jgi:hypothetical protein